MINTAEPNDAAPHSNEEPEAPAFERSISPIAGRLG